MITLITLDPKRQRRKLALYDRLAPDVDADTCPIPGCGRPSQARVGSGLSVSWCRYHVQFRNRHGSYWKGTYSAAELRPYRKAAERYIKAHSDDFWIAAALRALRNLMNRAGSVEAVSAVRAMPPRDKARAALARLRSAKIPPERLLAIHLAVSAALEEDPIGAGSDRNEYRIVQIAKAAHRQRSGDHSVYGPGARYDRYPRSAGLALRHLGKMIDRCCEHVMEKHLGALLALKCSLYGARERIVVVGKP
jgi:hypothetical protein